VRTQNGEITNAGQELWGDQLTVGTTRGKQSATPIALSVKVWENKERESKEKENGMVLGRNPRPGAGGTSKGANEVEAKGEVQYCAVTR